MARSTCAAGSVRVGRGPGRGAAHGVLSARIVAVAGRGGGTGIDVIGGAGVAGRHSGQ
jgi:hypothetical protein